MYKHIRIPAIGKELSVEKEPGNFHDNFVDSMVKIDYTVGRQITELEIIHARVQAVLIPAPFNPFWSIHLMLDTCNVVYSNQR